MHLTFTPIVVDDSCMKGLFTMLKPFLPTLVDFYIECAIDDEDELYGLYHELEKMIGQNVVETIKLMIWVSPGNDCKRWVELDDVLMGSPEGWPALRKVSLSMHVVGTYTDVSDKVVEELQGLFMTKMMESKRVHFDYQFRDERIKRY